MKKMIVLICLMTQSILYSQDSISIKFSELYNNFRKENNLPALQYSMELEKFAEERLKVTSDGTTECFPCRDWNLRCPTKDLHYKFEKMVKEHNKDSMSKYIVITENVAVISEFIDSKIRINREKPIDYGKEEVVIDYHNKSNEEYEYKFLKNRPIKDDKIPYEFFNEWIGSSGHKINFQSRMITHFAFKIYRAIHNGNPYLHGIWIAGSKK